VDRLLPSSRGAFLLVALIAAWACGACAAAPAPAPGVPPSEPRFGIDSTNAYAHGALEMDYQEDPESASFHSRSVWMDANTAIQGLIQAHAYRLVVRLGAASRFPNRTEAGRYGPSETSGRIVYSETGLTEASLRLRFGPSDANDGIQFGLMPLQGNPDAILYGNYLARYQPNPLFEGRELGAWDSLGALAPRVAGIRLALGRSDGPVRAEGWLVRDEEYYSWLAFLSGRAPRKVEWGLGVSGHRAFTFQDHLVTTSGKTLPIRDSPWGGPFIETDTLPSSADTVTYTFSSLLFSARASLDFASLFGSDAPGRYGGVFAEAALLGSHEVPEKLSDRWRRLSWTAGTRIPTFGWLDACVFQVEWRRDPADVFYYGLGNGSWIPVGAYRPPRPSPWSEALFLAKGIGPHVEAQARAATFRDSAGRGWLLSGRFAFRFR
jgi:hypothetical protein